MKRMIIAALALLVSTLTFAQKVVLTGSVDGLTASNQVMVMNYATNAQTPVTMNADGTFRLEMDIQEPQEYYFISADPKGGIKFYLEPGVTINMKLGWRDTTVEGEAMKMMYVKSWDGPLGDCQQYVEKHSFFDAQNEVMLKAQTTPYQSFRQFREDFRCALDRNIGDFVNSTIGTPTFRKFFREQYERLYTGGLTWYGELGTPKDSDYVAYMNSFDRANMENLQKSMVYGNFYKRYYAPEGTDADLFLLQNINKIFTNPEVAKAVATNVASVAIPQAPAAINEIYQAYEGIVGKENVSAEIAEQYNHYKDMVPGAKAVNFDMYTVTGKKVLLSDLKGKAVYIDCWATWCGPCKQQTPYMKKLYEHFKGDKRILFISVSLDKNTAAWKKMVAQEKLEWPQYIVKDEFNCQLCKAYGIDGIPRFMMFDKNGRIISLDAPRPSSDDIIEWIESKL